MFQVGDRVKTTDVVSQYWDRLKPGMEGEIVHVYEVTKMYPYLVQLDALGVRDPFLLFASEVEAV